MTNKRLINYRLANSLLINKRKFRITFLPLLVLSAFSMNGAQAVLSATTANTIEGTKPYLELSDGTALTDLNVLLGFSMPNPDGSATKVQVDTSMVGGDIITPVGMKFNDVKALIDADGVLHNLSTTGVKVGDADGDVSTLNPGTVTGNMKATWYTRDNVQVTNLNQSLSLCDSPYKLKIAVDSGTAVSANTTYGAPRINPFTGAIPDATYTFKLPASTHPKICYAKPDMTHATGQYAGPASEWDPSKGFIPQPGANPVNFPTTGANGLYFDLEVAGIDADSLTWPANITVNGIKATITNITATSVRVTLMGPAATTAQHALANPGAITKPTLPATFVIAGKSGTTTKVSYSFTINSWYINRGSKWATATDMGDWCSGAGYGLPGVTDLTNANGSGWTGGTSSGNYYQRRIGGGLFSEWGRMHGYTGAVFVSKYYWASDTTIGYQFAVDSRNGNGVRRYPTDGQYGVCTF